MIISGLIAKLLLIVDALLGFWVNTDATTTAGLPGCPSATVINATLTGCGESLVGAIAGVAELGIVALNAVFAGLLAYSF